MRLRALALAATATAAVAAVPAQAALVGPVPQGAAAAADAQQRFIVRFTPGSSARGEAEKLRGQGAKVERVLGAVFPGAVVTLPARAAAGLSRNPNVAAVEADAPVRVADTQSSAPWGLDRTDQRALPLSGTYTYATTASTVSAYVVDSGVRADHVELSGRVRAGYDAFGTGTSDCNGHGTHVAGTVAGKTYGMAKATAVVAVKVLDCNGSGTVSGVISGLDWAVADHAAGSPAVLNMSLSGGASDALDTAVRSAYGDGISVSVAAGNDNVDACTKSPARVAEALTVGATERTDARASYSNTGSCLDVFAPGSGIVSAWHTGSTALATSSGTSMASPHVAGAAALVLAENPGATPSQVAQHLMEAATTNVVTSAGTGSPNRLLHIASGTVAPAPVATAPPAPTNVTAKAGKRSAAVSWTQSGDGGSAVTSSTVYVRQGSSVVGTATLSGSGTSLTVKGLRSGVGYSFTVAATNAVGTSPQSAASNVVYPR